MNEIDVISSHNYNAKSCGGKLKSGQIMSCFLVNQIKTRCGFIVDRLLRNACL